MLHPARGRTGSWRGSVRSITGRAGSLDQV